MIDNNNPSFVMLPINNDRTAWRPIGFPVVMAVPRKRDAAGEAIPNSQVYDVKVYIESVPRSALVAGHTNVGLRFPDRELYAKYLTALDLAERLIDVSNYPITRNGVEVEYSAAEDGDIVNFITASGVKGTFEYLIGADYYDFSDILIENETLPPDVYNLVYECQYNVRVIAKDYPLFVCIDASDTAFALMKMAIKHPGAIIEEFYRRTPTPYLTSESRSNDTTVDFYRPFTDILHDVYDEQTLLGRINWVYDISPSAIPYLSTLLGWDLPYFPQSLDSMRKAVLRRTAELQNLKGSKRAIVEIFRLFGLDILINNLWYSSDGKRFIAPDATLPVPYTDEQIVVEELCQTDVLIGGETPVSFNEYVIPLLYRPQLKAGIDNFKAPRDIADVTLDAYYVETGSPAYEILSEIVDEIKNNVEGWGGGCDTDADGYLNNTELHDRLAGESLLGHSKVLIKGSAGDAVQSFFKGVYPPLKPNGVALKRDDNRLKVILNGYFDQADNGKVFLFATYERLEAVVPAVLKDLQSNRFDIQILTRPLDEVTDPTVVEFALEFLYRLKSIHSLLNVIRTRAELTENYEVTDICFGGDFIQRYDTELGRLQVPPAIIPDADVCKTPEQQGYKPEDLVYRQRKIEALGPEYEAWRTYDDRSGDLDTGDSRLSAPQPALGRNASKFSYLGQDRVIGQRVELRDSAYGPSPNANQNGVGLSYNTALTPVTDSVNGNFTATGAAASSNGDGKSYGQFVREYTEIRTVLSKLDGYTDYCYKGRVDDELLYKPTIATDESYRHRPCSLGMGVGVYWTYPTVSIIARPGTSKPVNSSKTSIQAFSGLAPDSTIIYHNTGLLGDYLKAGNGVLPKKSNSILGKLLRNYSTPNGQTLHYTNRQSVDSIDQKDHLAIQRIALDIQKPTLHLPGCRFAMMYALENDYIDPNYRARPYDDAFATSCGVEYACGDQEPTYLNYYIEEVTNGNEVLVYDDMPYTVYGNGLKPDIASLSDHSILPDYYDENSVIHKVYMLDADSKPAITFDQVTPLNDTLVDLLIETEDPLFNSATECSGSAGVYKDFADGYPSVFGVQLNSSNSLSRSGQYDTIMSGLGLNDSLAHTTYSYTFTCNSGIRTELGVRLDCGCSKVECDDVTDSTDPRYYKTICSLSTYLDDGEYDWDSDHIVIHPYMLLEETIGANSLICNGEIPSLLEVV